MSADPILRAHGIRKSFGGLIAVDVEELSVERGTIVALIGPNGAGKTTLFNILTGFERPDGGSWTFDGTEVTGWPSYRMARAGMTRTFQVARALAGMTVLENMMLAAPGQRGERLRSALNPGWWREQERAVEARAAELLEWVGLADQRDAEAGTLSGGQRKLLELGRALMTDPRLVMLDEPIAGVNPALAERLLDRVTALRDLGLTVLFIEHDMDVVANISDRVLCMAQGEVIASGDPASVVRDPRVIDAYLGEHHGEAVSGR